MLKLRDTLKFYSDSVYIKLISNYPRMIPEQRFTILGYKKESDREAIARIIENKLSEFNIKEIIYL